MEVQDYWDKEMTLCIVKCKVPFSVIAKEHKVGATLQDSKFDSESDRVF